MTLSSVIASVRAQFPSPSSWDIETRSRYNQTLARALIAAGVSAPAAAAIAEKPLSVTSEYDWDDALRDFGNEALDQAGGIVTTSGNTLRTVLIVAVIAAAAAYLLPSGLALASKVRASK